MIDMDHSSQSDVSSCHPSHAANAYTRTHAHAHAHIFTDTLSTAAIPTSLPPPVNSPESLITWAASQRISDYTFSTAPQAQRWRAHKEEVLAQLAGHGCSETTVLHANQLSTMHCGKARLWLAQSGGCCGSHSVFVLLMRIVLFYFFTLRMSSFTGNKKSVSYCFCRAASAGITTVLPYQHCTVFLSIKTILI